MLDPERILRETFVRRVEHHREVGSTNDRARLCASDGEPLPLLVVADRQTAGRGRGTHRWWTGEGSLALSLLVEPRMVGAERGPSPLVALAIAVAVVDAVAPLLPSHRVGIHWPNDVMAADRKLAGILIEALPDRRHIIGIGLNSNSTVADAPAELRTRVATLRDLAGRPFDQTTILVELLRLMQQQFASLRDATELVAARADELCLQKGQTLTHDWAGRMATGQCRGIAHDGALLLETAAGLQRCYSGTLTASEAS